MTDSKKEPQWVTKVDRRSDADRRQFSYTAFIPERRSGKGRRIKESRGKTYLLNIEDNSGMEAEEICFKKN